MAESPFVLTETVTVLTGVTLTVESGVTVMGSNYSSLWVEGHLEAVGTITEPITFTSSADTGPGEWYGIDFIGGTGHLNYVHVRYTHEADSIIVDGPPDVDPVIIENSVIRNNLGYPVMVVTGNLYRLQLNNVSASNNMANRIRVYSTDDTDNFLTRVTRLTAVPGMEGYEFGNYGLNVPTGITLTLDPGVVLMGSGSLWVEGHLEAVGTETEPITFTSSTNTGPGEWYGIDFIGGTGHLNHAEIRYTRMAESIIIDGLPDAGPVIVENSVIRENLGYPLMVVTGNLHRLQLNNVSATNNMANRVRVYSTDNTDNLLTRITRLTAVPGMEGYEFGNDGLNVPTGITLTIDPGVVLMGSGSLRVEGHLEAVGTMGEPITFTSSADTGPGEWGGLVISSTATLNHAIVRNGQRNLEVLGTAGQVLIANSEISQASENGLRTEAGEITAVCTTFTNNSGDAIDVAGSPDVTVFSSNISGNGGGVNNVGSAVVDARHNWWGNASGPGGDGPGSGDAAWGDVLYDPWLIAESGCTQFRHQVFLPAIMRP